MPRFYSFLVVALFLLVTAPTFSQTLDPTFAPTVLKNAASTNFLVRSLEVQPDGKVVVGGDFDFVDGTLCNKLMRLNADGTRDVAFSTANGTGPDGIINVIAVQADGKIIIGGEAPLYTFNAHYIRTLTRLTADGSLDPTFQTPPLASFARIRALALQPDGRILVGGEFHDENGFTHSSIVRLNSNGSYDPSFIGSIYDNSTATGPGKVETICVQADGKIVVGGTFGFSNGAPVTNLMRLNANGSTDASFVVGSGTNNAVRSIVQQPDGKLLLGGYFTQFNGQTANRLLRLLPNGTPDNTFQPGAGPNDAVMRIRLRPDGSMILMGAFTQYSGVLRGRVAHISATGSLNATFSSGAGANNIVYDVLSLPNGQLLAGGLFKSFDNSVRTGLARFSSAAILDPGFALNLEIRGNLENVWPLNSGKLLIQGRFTEFNGLAVTATSSDLHRLNADGSYDTRIVTAQTGTYYPQPDGSIYVLWHPGGTATNKLNRLLPIGANDANFAPVTLSYPSETIATNSMGFNAFTFIGNGRFALAGYFSAVNGVAQTYNRISLFRVLPTGGIDPSFVVPSNAIANNLSSCLLQPDGKLVAVQSFYDGNAFQTQLLRLNTNGSVDASFSVGSGPSPQESYQVLMQPNGQLIVQGSFTSFNGQATPKGIVRLNLSGSIDNGFNPAKNGAVLVQSDGRIITTEAGSGPFFQNLRRINSDGSTDASFAVNDILLASVYSAPGSWWYLSQLPNNGNLFLWGNFLHIDGQVRMNMVRFTNTLLATHIPHVLPELAVSPNPAQHQLTLRLPVTATSSVARPVELLDLQGRVVRRWTMPAQQTEATFPIGTTAAGVYVLRTVTAQGSVQQRVVVQP
jgi:uncharacterized delta-60 repeat protein